MLMLLRFENYRIQQMAGDQKVFMDDKAYGQQPIPWKNRHAWSLTDLNANR